MPNTATIVRVFIASPGDVPKERAIVRSTVANWNSINAFSRKLFLDPIGWETHAVPSIGDRPQAIINKQILEDADLLIAVFWTRLGTATGEYASGTVEEIEEHLAAKKPAMIYFSDAPVVPSSVDEKQYKAVTAFRKELEKRGIVESYSDISEFAHKLNRQLNQNILSMFPPGAALEQTDDEDPKQSLRDKVGLGNDAIDVLEEAGKGQGIIGLVGRGSGGTHIQINNTVLDTSTPRLCARWEAAIAELANGGYIADQSYDGEMFSVTDLGYKLLDALGLSAE